MRLAARSGGTIMFVDMDRRVAEIAADHPWSMRIFERLGIDYLCGHSTRSVREAAEAAGIDVRTLKDTILATQPGTGPSPDWQSMRPSEIVNHIIATHHDYARAELNRLDPLITRLLREEGEKRPELHLVRSIFDRVRDELLPHMEREEMLLFPLIRALDRGMLEDGMSGAVRVPIQSMCREHDGAERLFGELRCVTALYAIPEDASLTWRAVMYGLSQLESDLLEHMYLEDDVLFPAVAKLQGEMLR